MSQFHFQSVPHIISGLGSIQELKSICTKHGYQHVLIITDTGMIQRQLQQPITELFDDIPLSYRIYSNLHTEPTAHGILDALAFAQAGPVDLVLGFGGGSVMDVAKVIAVLAHPEQQQELHQMYGIEQAMSPRLPLILVPTTAGTGSEVTPISVITTSETTKTGIVSPILFADIAILDGHFTQHLPASITAATGIDAMVHAVEAYTSKLKKNLYADYLAKHALSLLNQNFIRVLQHPTDLEARQNMLLGSMLAGQAFANAPVAAVHALAYPLGGYFHIPHGHSNALVFIEVLKFNAPVAKQHYAELMQWLDPRSSGSVDGLCDLFIDHIQSHLAQSGLSLKLSQLNIPRNSLEGLAEAAMLQTRLLQNNPRPLAFADALAIYQAIY